MANNTWSNYTEKTATPVDTDEVMARDSTDGKNKRLLFGTFWKWVAKKLNEATISELQTSNKTIIGAINALNSETFFNPKQLKKTDDLNVLSPGFYVSENYEVPLNSPNTNNFYLINAKIRESDNFQIIFSLNAQSIYWRIFDNSIASSYEWSIIKKQAE